MRGLTYKYLKIPPGTPFYPDEIDSRGSVGVVWGGLGWGCETGLISVMERRITLIIGITHHKMRWM